MSSLPVYVSDGCTGCWACLEVCPFNAIVKEDGKAKITEACRACGACVEVCPVSAIEMAEVKGGAAGGDRGVMVFGEISRGRLHRVSLELLGKARELASELGEPVYAVLIGHGLEESAEELVRRGAEKVFLYEDEELARFRVDPYSDILAACCREVKPSIVLIGATSLGRSLGPRVAAKLGTGLTADCTRLEIDRERRLLLQTRPAYGGNIMATIITPSGRPQMATVRYKMFKEAEPVPNPTGVVVRKKVDLSQLHDRIKILGFEPAPEEASISDADVVVSGGLGMGSPEGFKLMRELAELLGGAVGASRPTVDEGWIDYRHQVGLSGRTVRPKVYLACGISGAVQHQAGMKTSDVIISINKDPEAPIFKISNLGVVGDLYEVVPILIEKLKRLKQGE